MTKYKAIVQSPFKHTVEIQDVESNSYGEAYNQVAEFTSKEAIITILNLYQWNSLSKQIQK